MPTIAELGVQMQTETVSPANLVREARRLCDTGNGDLAMGFYRRFRRAFDANPMQFSADALAELSDAAAFLGQMMRLGSGGTRLAACFDRLKADCGKTLEDRSRQESPTEGTGVDLSSTCIPRSTLS